MLCTYKIIVTDKNAEFYPYKIIASDKNVDFTRTKS